MRCVLSLFAFYFLFLSFSMTSAAQLYDNACAAIEMTPLWQLLHRQQDAVAHIAEKQVREELSKDIAQVRTYGSFF
ncbi:MAG: hypothetical protein PVJ92_02470, partial [Candidatus Dependentiae bacterium]